MSDALSPMERDVLNRYGSRYAQYGFPDVSQIKVTKRMQTSAGRSIRLKVSTSMQMPDGELSLGKFSQLVLPAVPNGLNFSVWIESGRPSELEFLVNGEASWDGSELGWQILSPETGVAK